MRWFWYITTKFWTWKFYIPVKFDNSKIVKCNPSIWWTSVKITYSNKLLNLSKINLKSILREVPVEENWTKEQKKWMEKGIPIKEIFQKRMGTFNKVEDYKTKTTMNYWGKLPRDCICGLKFTVFHFLTECTFSKSLQNGLIDNNNICREHQFNPKSNLFLQSWIINWCSWKTYQ